MARIDFRTVKRSVGRDGKVRLPGTIVPEEEWTTWANPGVYVDHHDVEVVIDGETISEHIQSVLGRAMRAMRPASVRPPMPTYELPDAPDEVTPPPIKKPASKKAG